MTKRKDAVKNAIDAFNQGFHGTTSLKPTPPAEKDKPSTPAKK